MEQGKALITTRNEEETLLAGAALGREIEAPLVITLQGELGTGKTVFVRGAAAGLGVTGAITSPSFVLMKIYRGRLPLYHFDFYRLDESASLDDLGFEEYLPGKGAAFVEWAGNLAEILPPQRLEIVMERFYDHRGEGRRICFTPRGEESARLLKRALKVLNRPGDENPEKPPRPNLEDRGKQNC